MKLNRNNACQCGSGKKYKHCCERKAEATSLRPSSATSNLTESHTALVASTPANFDSLLTLFNNQRYVELESKVKALLELYPDAPFAWQLLGGALQMQGKDALIAFQKVAALSPNDAEAHFNLGVAYKSAGQLEQAIANYRQALILKPNYIEASNNLGNVLKDIGQHDNNGLTSTLHQLNQLISLFNKGKFIEVESQARLLIAQFPESFVAWKLLGNCLHRQGKTQEALPALLTATILSPNDAEAHFNLAISQASLGQLHNSVVSYRKAILIKPDFAEAYLNLGTTLQHLGLIDDAIESYRKALEVKPTYVQAYSNLLFTLNHSEKINAEALFNEHLFFAEQFERPLQANWSQHENSRNSKRCLQVGFVSADLCSHAVASFLEPVLGCLAKYPQLSLHAYYNNTVADEITQRLKGYFKHWHSIANLSDGELAEKIRLDGIDILYDLSGHMANNRILTFARKPAPLQVSWIAYPCTTGLSAIDYYQADHCLFPNARLYNKFTEKIIRLPASSAFSPIKDAPPINALPALSNGYITFGSFNRISKINKSVVALWSQLIRALPNSKMLLGAMPKNDQYQILIEWFAQNGIERSRLSFHPNGNSNYYLSLHHKVDICLDTFPYNGETTTCNALWMGVPTLTLAGQTLANFVGTAILDHFNLQSFAAKNENDYVKRGLLLASNLAELSKIRAELRARFATSAKSQPELVAASMEHALRIMWERWCAGLPAKSLDA
jgi:protein O-GlcNAc transferase